MTNNTEENWHGKPGGYTNHNCRCDRCRAAWREYMVERRRIRRHNLAVTGRLPKGTRHGKVTTYQNYGCRCSDCTAASAASKRKKKN